MDTVMVDDAMAIREELEAIAADIVNPTKCACSGVPGRPHRELREGGLRPHHHGQSRPERREGLLGSVGFMLPSPRSRRLTVLISAREEGDCR